MERQLEAVALAVANADPRLIPPQIRNAYAAGATVAQVLTAEEVGRCLADVPTSISLEAQRSAENCAWVAQRKA